jgi:hypothetical protein
MKLTKMGLLGAALVVLAGAPAGAVEPEMVGAARAIQSACVAHGQDARVCACGVGLAYAQLDPKVFRLMPKVEPLLDLKDKPAQLMGLLSLATQNGLSVADLQAAADTIRANRETMNGICKPLIAGKVTIARRAAH